jgi:hypothetical protein
MSVRTAHRRVALLTAALVGSLTLGLAPAQATPAADPIAATDQLLFKDSLFRFAETRASADRPENLDWSSDGCTDVPDAPLGYDFLTACWRHDFGYRNYKAQHRFTENARARIDGQFKADMYTICNGRVFCQATAEVYYLGVRQFGG